MLWLYEQWRAFAEWTIVQPGFVRLAIGIAILTTAYLLFVRTLSWLLGTAKPHFPRVSAQLGDRPESKASEPRSKQDSLSITRRVKTMLIAW